MSETTTIAVSSDDTEETGPHEGASESDASSFADLLETYDYEQPERGQIMQGVILRTSKDEVLIDVGVKRDAIVTSRDLVRLEQEVLDRLEPGAEVTVYVLRPSNRDGELIVSINKALEQQDWARAEELIRSGDVAQCEVVSTNRGGLLVQFGRLRGFVPQSHILAIPRGASEEARQDAKEGLMGEELTLKVIDLDRRRDRLVLSERAARREAQRARLEELEVDQTITGQVVNLVDYGAFVDIGGIDGLIHISELDWQRVEHPRDVLSVGDEVEVRIKDLDLDRERISLSRKALLPSPWESVEQHYNVGDLVHGTVTNVLDFGAFVMLPNDLEGLIHVSEMSTYGVSQPADLVRKGDEVPVKILDINPKDERISLSLDAVSSEQQLEWMAARHEEAEESTEDESEYLEAEGSAGDEGEDPEAEESVGEEVEAPVAEESAGEEGEDPEAEESAGKEEGERPEEGDEPVVQFEDADESAEES